MPSIDAVIQALKDYSHLDLRQSRHPFHKIIGQATIRIEAGKTTNFAGDYDYYL